MLGNTSCAGWEIQVGLVDKSAGLLAGVEGGRADLLHIPLLLDVGLDGLAQVALQHLLQLDHQEEVT